MLRELLHLLPAPLLFLVIAAAILVPLSLAVWRLRLDRPAKDRADDNVMTASIRFVGGAFALLSAFIIVSLSNQSSAAKAAVRAEAAAAESFAREAQRLPGVQPKPLLRGVEAYLEAVIRDEWPLMREPSHEHDPADDEMDRLFDLLLASDDATEGYDSRYDLAVKSLDRLELRRAERLLVSRDPLSAVLWTVLLVSAGTMLLVAAMYPAGPTRALKWIEVLSIGTVVAIVLFVVVAYDHAYDGFLAVSPRPLQAVLEQIRATPHAPAS